MTHRPDRVALPAALAMLVCLDAQVSRLDTPPAYVGLRPGAGVDFQMSLTQDECCQGLAWVRVDGIFPSSVNFPNPDQTPLRCGVGQWGVALEIGIVRCAPTPSAQSIVLPDEYSALAEALLADFAAMDCAIQCMLDGWKRVAVVGRWTPLSLATNCAGGTMTVTVAAPACNCAEDESTS
jgi:hypothetical protein